ncbi:MAG: coenzyme F420-0:L-glutamate ligase [Acidobacteria bacterium]|nr:coenzyme F420-0:L-glutamate ligase [Acidobacteriota bacterium]
MPSGRKLHVIPIPFAGEVKPGDDLAEKLAAALKHQKLELRSRDILVVKHKIVAKAEGRIFDLRSVRPSPPALAWARLSGGDPRVTELALRESRRIVRQKHGVLITETRHGFVCANSGVDVSNVDGGQSAVLLPKDPDHSAARLRSRLKKLSGVDIAVIVSDSFGRPWRQGLTEVAIGVAGMKPLLDYRGRRDEHGYELHATAEAVADEIACAAGLVCGKLNRTPASIVRGLRFANARASARELIRPAKDDLFR